MTATGSDAKLSERRARARRLVSRAKLSRQLPAMIRRNPLAVLKWIELSALGRRGFAACYNNPLILQIEVTNLCNLKCRMCPREKEFEKEGITPGNMSFETFENVLRGWIGDIYQIHLFGRGEPLLAPELPRMIHYAASRGVPYITFSTNGHPLRGDVARAIAESDLDEVRVSIDGADEEGYRAVRGVSLESLKQNLRDFREMSDIPISISGTLSRENWESIRALPDLAAELGAVALRLYPVAPYTYLGVDDVGLTPEQKREYRSFCDDVKVRAKDKGVTFIPISHYAPSCNVPFVMTFIDVEGNMTVCCRLETMVVGNVLKEGFDNVWRGPAMQRWRRKILSRDFPKPCIDLECIHDWR